MNPLFTWARGFTMIPVFVWGIASGLLLHADDSTTTVDHSAATVAAEVDQLILNELQQLGTDPAAAASDEDFLRRVTLDLAGTIPTPKQVTLFGLNADPNKRATAIDGLLNSERHAETWARYWRDVIFLRATNQRAQFSLREFETWMTEQVRQNRPWDQVATNLLTATGDVRDNGDTALLFAHEGEPAEIAAEVSRIFLGIQLQCANCHDHPADNWKREQFHELAAFFPRVGVRPKQEDGRIKSYEIVSVDQDSSRRRRMSEFTLRRMDRNRDGKLSTSEISGIPNSDNLQRLLSMADTDGDEMLSFKEINAFEPPDRPGRGALEHFMPDLNDPSSDGTQIQPRFFVTSSQPPQGLPDHDRRETLALALTGKENPWFARALVNRLWAELIGEGFYTPIDDMGPEREARYPNVLEALCRSFTANNYDVRWLFRTITSTQTYQRRIRSSDPAEPSPAFAAATPTRLRADQVYDALLDVLGVNEQQIRPAGRGDGMYRQIRSPRAGFAEIFGFDPSTPQEDITGNIPQALFMMNSSIVNDLTRATGNTRLARILRETSGDDDAIVELYLLVLSREPSQRELAICRDHIQQAERRESAFEDLLWSLLNSSEFLSRR